jgi:glycyl-tRNA synthetase beta chain
MSRETLLIELGTEELPPTALRGIMTAFAEAVAAGLDQAGIERGEAQGLASPRHLAVRVAAVAERQPDREQERKGPALQAAFDAEGNPTRAAEGFARSCGVAVDELTRVRTDKGEWLAWRGVEPGQATAELLPGIVERAIEQLPLPKRMRWGSGDAAFVRPVHWLVLLHGEAVVPATLFGLEAGRDTRGHRFHHPSPIALAHADEYVDVLRERGRVMVDFGARRDRVREQVLALGREAGGDAVIDDALLDEVTALVEWPVALAGSFDRDFLRVPAEALVSSMQGHQKYFPVRDDQGRLLARFITVANIESRDPAQVVTGNERVIRPRLADAAFFWDQDRQRPLAERAEALRSVVFQQQLGSLNDKSERVAELAAGLAEGFAVAPDQARAAARLAKADLVTEMVGEFPELQGVMGRYYALEDGEPEAVAIALDEVYWPRHAGDRIPESPLGRLLAVAERIDTLVGIFGIGKAPSGAKDPFALRRAALGVLRIAIEGELDLDLRAAAAAAVDAHRRQSVALPAATADEVVGFLLERLRPYYQERGIGVDSLDAVMANAIGNPHDIDQRVRAVEAFRQLPEAAALTAANKRIRNILRKAEEAGEDIPAEGTERERLEAPAERELAQAVADARARVLPQFRDRDYTGGLRQLAALRPAVDRFFDEIMVMTEDAALRRNRLALLRELSGLFLHVADLAALQD